MARKLFALVIAAVFLCNLCGYYFIFLADQSWYRHEMKNLIRAGEFRHAYETMVFDNPDVLREIRWVNAKEFRYHGKLFDVVKMSVEGRKTTIVCINDRKEEQLIAGYRHYGKLLSGNQSQGRSRQNLALYHLIVKQALVRNFVAPPARTVDRLTFFYQASHYRSPAVIPAPPPPEYS